MNDSSPRDMIRNFLALMILAIIGFTIYSRTFAVPFIFDDHTNIVENPHIMMQSFRLADIQNITNGPSASRPVAMFTIALNFFFHRYDLPGYHLFNLLIHIITAWLVFLLTRHTLRLCQIEATLPVFLAATLWLVHPLHTQSVTYIIQRMNSLAALFSLLGIIAYIKGRLMLRADPRRPLSAFLWFTILAVSGLLALLSKPNAATLPLLLFFYEWFFFQNVSPAWFKKNTSWLIAVIVLFLFIALIYLGLRPVNTVLADYQTQPFTLLQRLLTEPRVILYYLSLLLFPQPERLTLCYDFPLSSSLATPANTSLALVTLFLLTATAFLAARRHRLPAFALLWFLINLAIESSFIGRAIIFEHRTYLPSVFIIMAAMQIWMRHIRPEGMAVRIALLVIILCCYGSYERNQTWRTALSFWQDAVNKAPEKAAPRSGLATAYMDLGRYEKAIICHQEALSLLSQGQETVYPEIAAIYDNLGMALEMQGHSDQSLQYCRHALALRKKRFGPHHPETAESYNNLGVAYSNRGDQQEAIRLLQKSLAIYRASLGTNHQQTAEVYNNLGLTHRKKGNLTQAMRYHKKALGIRRKTLPPGHSQIAQSFQNMAIVYSSRGEYKQAISLFRKALNIYRKSSGPNHPQLAKIYLNLGLTYERMGRSEQALGCYQNARRPGPPAGAVDRLKLAGHYNNLGVSYNNHQEYARALRNHRKALAIRKKFLGPAHPKTAESYNNLGVVYTNMQQYDRAIDLFQRAVDINTAAMGPGHTDLARIYNNLARPYYKQKKYPQAINNLEKALNIYRHTLGQENGLTRQILQKIDYVMQKQNTAAKQ